MILNNIGAGDGNRQIRQEREVMQGCIVYGAKDVIWSCIARPEGRQISRKADLHN